MLFAMLLNGCDDGDLTVETFDFDSVAIANCPESETTELLYKLKGQESLLLQIPKDKLKNEITGTDQPLELNIDNISIKLAYRAYDGTVTSANICDAIRPVSPNITNEWYATGGKLIIITKPAYNPAIPPENGSRITGYSHNIRLSNVTYSKPTGTQISDPMFTFGDFTTKLKDTETLTLVFDESAEICSESKQIYNINGSESLVIDAIDPALIANTPTTPGNPRIGNISPTAGNKVTFRVYSNGTITEANAKDYFCKTPTPNTPSVRETWIAESGTIQVETSTFGANFKHIITLRDVKLVKGNVSFILGNNFKSWELITIP